MNNRPEELQNFVGGGWRSAGGDLISEVWDPATGAVIARVRASSIADVADADVAAVQAAPGWRRTPANERVQGLFRLETLLEQRLEDLARC